MRKIFEKIQIAILIFAVLFLALPKMSANAMTSQEGANWALAQIGKRIDTDGQWGAQCVDLIVQYCKSNFGWNPQGSGDAKAYRTVKLPNSSWKRIQNTPEFVPQPGDIAIWNPASNNGNCGHVAIIISANVNNFVSVDQNWVGANSKTGSPAAKVNHDYRNFWGVIRPPFTGTPSVTVPTKPTLKSISVDGSTINVSWSSVSGAEKYTVDFWVNGGSHNYFSTTQTSMSKSMPDNVYGVRVCAENSAGNSGFTGFSYVTVPEASETKKDAVVSNGLYTLKNVSSGYMMNIYGGKDTNGTKVTTWEYDGTTDQRIYIQHKGDGKYILKFNASSNGRVIDVNRGESLSASIDDGDKIDIWTADDLTAQYFFINDCGNGAYSFELVSKTGHVIAAESASAAKSNGTQLQLRKWTGADYQKWYLCDTSGSIIGRKCEHGSVSKKVTDTTYEKDNDKVHNVIIKYNNVCKDCGETVKSNLTEEKSENHSISNDKCTLCGYEIEKEEIPVENECRHTKTYDGEVKDIEVKQNDSENHTVTETYDVLCSDCNDVIEKNKEKSYSQKHQLTDNRCSECGYASEDEICSHNEVEKTMSGKEATYEIKDEFDHMMVTYYDVYCKKCGMQLEKNEAESEAEAHSFSDNVCVLCGYEKETVKSHGFNDIYDEALQKTVEELSDFDIIHGYTDGSFKPNNQITRAEFSKIICETIMCGEGNDSGAFIDVSENHWARKYIYAAKNLGIINGTSATTFSPDANITYEQAIKMIVASLGYTKEAEAKGGYPNGFIAVATELGITESIYFNKTAYATRGNIAKLVRNAMNVPYYNLKNQYGNVIREEANYTLYENHIGR